MKQTYSVIYSPTGNVAVLNIPKCGSQLVSSLEICRSNNPKCKRLAFVRHPVDRIKSAYKFLRGAGQVRVQSESYEDFIDYTFMHSDQHWQPQIDFIDNTIDEMHKLKDIGKVLKAHIGYPVEVINKSRDYRTSDYRLGDILEKYADDVRLFDGIC